MLRPRLTDKTYGLMALTAHFGMDPALHELCMGSLLSGKPVKEASAYTLPSSQ